jgi:hypothetical protein
MNPTFRSLYHEALGLALLALDPPTAIEEAADVNGVGPIGRNVVHPDPESKTRSRAGISR